MNLLDTISLSYRTIRGNKLRTAITVAIIALGIASLVGIRTAIEAMTQKFTESFSAMGANGFNIRYRPAWRIGGGNNSIKKEKKGRKEKRSNQNKPITRIQAETFKEKLSIPAKVSISLSTRGDAIVSANGKKTNPTVWIAGGDDNYLELNGYEIETGRNLNALDIQSGRNVCIIGKELVKELFNGNAESALEKIIRVKNIPFRVIGTLKEKGSTLGRNSDKGVITSYNNVRRFFSPGPNASFSIAVKVPDVRLLEPAIGEAEGLFRSIRKLTTTEEDNFLIDKSDSLVELLMKNLSVITGAAVVIGFITLMGAAIGLMNIMLVAVTERTKEIGLVKAIGGKQSSVRAQFLFESIIISLLGAFFGIVVGVILGNSVSMLMNTGFVIPWLWVGLGIFICTVVGLLAGLYPAMKASKLNPIEALRYE
jgi:putative ABC transport system permease protein